MLTGGVMDLTGKSGLHTVHVNGKMVVMTTAEFKAHSEQERLHDQDHEAVVLHDYYGNEPYEVYG